MVGLGEKTYETCDCPQVPGKGVSRAQFLCSAEHPKDLRMSDLTEKQPGVQCLWSLSSDPLPRAVGF